MKIEGGRPVGATGGTRKAAGAGAASGFTPADVEAPQRSGAAPPASAVTSLDVIIALQAEEPPARRRARQTKRGHDALDALEKLEQGLLFGRAPAALKADLERLARLAEPTGDVGLDALLQEIDIRLAVELAKLERLTPA